VTSDHSSDEVLVRWWDSGKYINIIGETYRSNVFQLKRYWMLLKEYVGSSDKKSLMSIFSFSKHFVQMLMWSSSCKTFRSNNYSMSDGRVVTLPCFKRWKLFKW